MPRSTVEKGSYERADDLVADPVTVLQAEFVFRIKGADQVGRYGGRFGNFSRAILCACYEERGFAIVACRLEAVWGAEGRLGMVGGIAFVEDDVIFDVELFEEPEDSLRLGALEEVVLAGYSNCVEAG